MFIAITVSLSYSCTSQDRIERQSIEPTIVKTDLMTSMPGELLAIEDTLVWFDLNPDAFLHVEDAKSGETLTELGRLGNGPEDFTAPFISWHTDRSILVSDCFAERAMVLSLDSLKMNHLELSHPKKSLQCVGNNRYVCVSSEREYPFILYADGIEATFGNYPMDYKAITNAAEVFQGITTYNPYTSKLLYSIPELSYIALYKQENKKFVKQWEKQFPGLDYKIDHNGVLHINKVTNPAPSAMAMTKDYIVTIERDSHTKETKAESDSDNRFLRNFSKSPQTLFVYDYDFNLKRILHTQIPMFRLSASGNNNTIYFIGVKGEFCIAKCSLD